MIPRLFTPLVPSAGGTVQLDPAAAHHAVRVLRLGAGAPVELFDGQGRAAVATILSPTAGTVRIERVLASPSQALKLTLAQCISAAEKMDWTIEKAVELGVAAIVPLQSQKATVKLTAERSARRREHWQRLILAASAQSGQNHVPHLHDMMKLDAFLSQPVPACAGDETGCDESRGALLRLILHPRAGGSLNAILGAQEAGGAPGIGAVWLLCGPESGFSEAEYQLACAAGWLPAGLGPRVLRTETAGLVALAVVQARWGELR